MNPSRMVRKVLVLALSLALAAGTWAVLPVPQARAATTYTWNQTGTAAWNVAANWTPARSSPATDDVLQFNGGGTITATSVLSETIGQLLISSSTAVNLQVDASSTYSLTVGGTSGGSPMAGDDLSVGSASALNVITGTGTLYVYVGTGATGSISGNVTFLGRLHRLQAADASAITFNSGSTFTQGLNCTGNVFTNWGPTNVIVFASGSTFVHQAGSNPFGLNQPSSKVVFQSGSLYRFENTAGTGAAFSGRTYANFEMNASGATVSGTGGSPLSIDDLTVTDGTLNLGMTGAFSITGNISVASGKTLNFNAANPATVALNGSSSQTIGGVGTLTFGNNESVGINNASGVILNRDIAITATLYLTNGLVTLGSSNLTLGSSASIGGSPSASSMVVAPGTGSGELRKNFSGTGSFTFPVGDNTGTAEYSPITLNFTSGTFGGGAYAGVGVTNGKQPNNSSPTDYLNRYWTVTSSNISGLACTVTCNYVAPADVQGTESNIYGGEWNGSAWRMLPRVVAAGHYFTGTVSSFSDFTGGQGGYLAVTLASFSAVPAAGAGLPAALPVVALGLAAALPLGAFLLNRRRR